MAPSVKKVNSRSTQQQSHETQNNVRRSASETVPPTTRIKNGGGAQGGGDVESDGTQQKRDAPGQLCVYVPPGEQANEFYRLATFAKYPNNVPANVRDMAAAGFCYTGFKDRVKCFSCGSAVENWIVGDDGMGKKWHKSDCKLMAGQEPLNKPLPGTNIRTLLRTYKGLPNPIACRNVTDRIQRNSNTNAPPPLGTPNNATASLQPSTPIDSVTSNMSKFRISEASQPPVRLARVEDPEHRELLLRLNLRSEADRRKTFEKWPSYPAPYLPSQLAKEGFFYLGNTDRTQCFSCSGILRNWASTDNVHEQHRIHLPACRIARELEAGNIPMTEAQRRTADESDRVRMEELLSAGRNGEPPNPTAEEQRHLATHFPCNRPANGHMESLQARIASFDSRWPATVNASIEHLARAGFYYLGESDKTKCFYCNGGLQNWEMNDEPWTEHAKWFPGCEYVIRQKGVDFVRRLKEAHPNLNRPSIRNSVSYDIPPAGVQRPPVSRGNENQTRINIDQVLSMGFSRQTIDNAIQRQACRGGYATTEQLINDLADESNSNSLQPNSLEGVEMSLPIAANAGTKREGDEDATTPPKKTRMSSPTLSNGSEMAESLKAKEAEVLCKKCMKSKACMVFIPCGHLSVCETCSNGMKKCFICASRVQEAMKVFRA